MSVISEESSLISGQPENGCFTFIWKIEKFSFCPHDENERLESPSFNIESLDGTEWHLGIFPGRYKITCHVYRVNNLEEPEFITTDFKYSFITSDGSAHYWCEMNNIRFKRGTNLGYIEMDRRNKDFKDIFLPSDTLTVMCHLRNSDNIPRPFTQCVALTRIGVERRCFSCTINNFLNYRSQTKVPVKVTSKRLPSLEMTFICTGGAVCEEALQIMIKKVGENVKRSMFLTCKITVLDANGNVGFSAQDEHSFKVTDYTNEWKFPSFIKVNKISASKDHYLKNDKLSLRCEFAISSGVSSQEIEDSIEGIQPRQTENQITFEDRKTLKKDLESLYFNGGLCDVKLRAGNETISAHWIILCARSVVFRAMFDSDMKEKNSGVVDIPDLSPADLNRMLLFLYTDSLGDLQWDTAKSLYVISDLYQIEELKRQCVSFMVSHISVASVCDVLLFGDLYSDETLTSAVQDFISEHSDKVFKSKEWENLMICNSKVTADIMHYTLTKEI